MKNVHYVTFSYLNSIIQRQILKGEASKFAVQSQQPTPPPPLLLPSPLPFLPSTTLIPQAYQHLLSFHLLSLLQSLLPISCSFSVSSHDAGHLPLPVTIVLPPILLGSSSKLFQRELLREQAVLILQLSPLPRRLTALDLQCLQWNS